MTFPFAKGKNAPCTTCNVINVVVGVIAVLATLASIFSVYHSHFLPDGLTFGTSQGSASLIALALNLFLLKKVGEMCMCNCTLKK